MGCFPTTHFFVDIPMNTTPAGEKKFWRDLIFGGFGATGGKE